jgi:hypothetical protein
MPCLTSQRENIMEDNYEEQSKEMAHVHVILQTDSFVLPAA